MAKAKGIRGAQLLGLAIPFFLALAACTSPSPSPTEPARSVTESAVEALEAAPCPSESFASIGLPSVEGLLCGTLTVPIDRTTSASADAKTDLAVVMTDEDAPRGVLLLLGGGPGGSATWSVPLIRAVMPEVAAAYQLIAIDQRGTGSGALDCPAVQSEVGSSDILAPSAAAVDACATALDEWRDSLSTEASVADLEDLRLALGGPSWVLDGTSYGTYVAQRYALSHPGAVDALVLDSVVPLEGVDPFLLSSFEALPRVLTEVCEQSCATDPLADIAAVIAEGYEPVPLFNMLVAHSVAAPSFNGVAEALASARAGELGPLDELVGSMETAAASPLSMFSAGTHIAALCSDIRSPWSASVTSPSERASVLADAIDALSPEQTWPFPTTIAGELATVSACLRWPASETEAFHSGDLPDVPVLLLTGERDLSTPVANAQQLAEQIERPSVVTVPKAGHSVQMQPAGATAVTQFLLENR